jgi:hypothetical protein
MTLHTIGTVSVEVAKRNAARQTIVFTNRSTGGQVIYLAKGAGGGLQIDNAEYVLEPAAVMSFVLFFDGADIRDSWDAVADAAGAKLYIGETSFRNRGD